MVNFDRMIQIAPDPFTQQNKQNGRFMMKMTQKVLLYDTDIQVTIEMNLKQKRTNHTVSSWIELLFLTDQMYKDTIIQLDIVGSISFYPTSNGPNGMKVVKLEKEKRIKIEKLNFKIIANKNRRIKLLKFEENGIHFVWSTCVQQNVIIQNIKFLQKLYKEIDDCDSKKQLLRLDEGSHDNIQQL